MATKLNSMRLLDSRKIPYRATTYDEAGEFHSATDAAELLGAPAAHVYKTLVVMRESASRGKPLLVMIASDREVDLKGLAKSLGEKRLRMASLHEAESLTGLQVGGISALSLLNRGFEVCIDEPALGLESIHVSAGQRGVDLELSVRDLVALTRARRVRATVDREDDSSRSLG